MASSHDEFDDFLDSEPDEEVVDTKADGRLLRVPLGRMSPNLVNPRTEFGTKAELEDFGKSLKRRQIQAVPVVTKAAYLRLWPEHEQEIGSVDVVIVSGERRYRAATAVRLPGLDCVINDDVAETRKTFMEAVVSENVDRQNFDPVEEAYAVQALVTEFGTNRSVAQHFERADGWVTQRILLTHLAPELQAMVRKKAIPLEFARNLGKLARDNSWSGEEQAMWWSAKRAELMEQSKERKAEKKAAKKPTTPPSSPERKQADPPSQAAAEPQRPVGGAGGDPGPSASPAAPAAPALPDASETVGFTAVKRGAEESSQEEDAARGEQEAAELSALTSLPWHNPAAILRILREHMQPADFERLMKEGAGSL
jgi:ParB family chromosome partitioning protein